MSPINRNGETANILTEVNIFSGFSFTHSPLPVNYQAAVLIEFHLSSNGDFSFFGKKFSATSRQSAYCAESSIFMPTNPPKV
jgi:hypothetical protein